MSRESAPESHSLLKLASTLVLVPAILLAGTVTTIDFPGAYDTICNGISPQHVIVGFYNVPFTSHGFVFQAGKFTTIDFPGADSTVVYGISPQGDLVGLYHSPGDPPAHNHGFLLRSGTFTTIDFPGAVTTGVQGINAEGDIVGSYSFIEPLPPPAPLASFHGFLLHQGTFFAIDFSGAFSTYASGINAEGDIVGAYDTQESSLQGFVLHAGKFATIMPAGVFVSGANGINERGDIVGFVESPEAEEAFLLRNGTVTKFGIPGATATFASGTNASGEITGAYEAGGSHCFLIEP